MQLGAELEQGCSEITGTGEQEHQQSIPHHCCCLCSSLPRTAGTALGSGACSAVPVILQEKLQGTHRTLSLPRRACFCGQSWMKMRMQISEF